MFSTGFRAKQSAWSKGKLKREQTSQLYAKKDNWQTKLSKTRMNSTSESMSLESGSRFVSQDKL